MDSFIECKDLIKNFLEMSGNKDNLSFLFNFDFRLLETHDKYKGIEYGKYKALEGEYGEDNLRLVRLIYYIIWGNYKNNEYALNGFTNADNGFFKYYGGDAIISNATQYIGNFMVLPRGKANNEFTTINIYKKSCFKDNFYKFILKMESIYQNYIEPELNKKKFPTNINQPLWQQIIDNNNFYFYKINTFKKFIKINMLEGWEYLNDKKNSDDFINCRSKKMCEKLIQNIKNYTK